MTENWIVFESMAAWEWLSGLYRGNGSRASLESGLGITFAEDFLRKGVTAQLKGELPVGVRPENSLSGQLKVQLSQYGVRVEQEDVDLSSCCWVIRVYEGKWCVSGPGSLLEEGTDLAGLRSFFDLEKSVDGFWHYNVDRKWRWDNCHIPRAGRAINVVVWDGYLFGQSAGWDLNLGALFEQILSSAGVTRLTILFCVYGGKLDFGADSSAIRELSKWRSRQKRVSIEYVIWNLRFTAGEEVGGHGRFLIADTFAIKSGKGFAFISDRRVRADGRQNRFDADGIDVFSSLCRRQGALRDFSKLVQRLLLISSSGDGLKEGAVSEKAYLHSVEVASPKGKDRVYQGLLCELQRIWLAQKPAVLCK